MILESLRFLTEALSSQTVAVRVSASWALANVSDALCSCAESAPINSRDVEGSTALVDILSLLGRSTVQACKDCDKVQANGVRASGYVVTLSTFFEIEDGKCRALNDSGPLKPMQL